MKIFHQFLIIVIIGLVLFIARDDVKVVYNKAVSYLSKNIDASKVVNNIIIRSEKILTPTKSIITPGALKGISGLASNAGNVTLSVKSVIIMTNKNRADNGNLKALIENSKLNLSAQKKLDDMFKQQYFEHVSPDGVGVSDLGKQVSYDYIVIGENLALGNFKDAKALLDAWMASPGHRANILNNKYTELGVAVGHGMYEGRDIWLAVQHFGLPRSICPSINEVLQGLISLDSNNIKSMESDLLVRKQKIDSGVVYEGKTSNEQINEYNQLVNTYNDLINQLKEKIADYNKGVREFNSCLSAYTEVVPSH